MGLTILDHTSHPVTHGRKRPSTGVRLHYYSAGPGPALLLQHGIPKTLYYWRKVVPLLSPHFTCIVPDLRGVGDSTHPDTGYDMATVADDITELMTALGHDTFHIVGEDWGAAAAYQVCARYPQRVLSLVFQEMLLPGFGLEEWAQFHPDRPGTHLWHVVFYYVRDVPELLIMGRERGVFYLAGCGFPFFGPGTDVGRFWVRAIRISMMMRSRNRATEKNVEDNKEAAKMKPKLLILAVGSKDFIGKEVKKQIENVADNVESL